MKPSFFTLDVGDPDSCLSDLRTGDGVFRYCEWPHLSQLDGPDVETKMVVLVVIGVWADNDQLLSNGQELVASQ